MDTDEFARITVIGLGRAVLHLRANDAARYRAAVLSACRQDAAFGYGGEGDRAQYLIALIQATRTPNWFRDRLLEALGEVPSEIAGSKIAAVLGHFAREGDLHVRQSLYDAYIREAAGDTYDLANTIVELDGAAGLLFVAEHTPSDKYEDIYPDSLVSFAEAKDGPEAVARALALGAAGSQQIASFTAEANTRHSADVSRGTTPQPDDLDYGRIRVRLDAGDASALLLLGHWAPQASDAELERAAVDLIKEKDPAVLHRYLWIFSHRRFPLDAAPLLDLAAGWEADLLVKGTLIDSVLSALQKISDARVRALGLMLIDRGFGRGAGLLAANYRDGDFALLEPALRKWTDPDEYHNLGFSLQDIVAANPLVDAVPALLIHYERGPCAMCRYGTVKALRDLGAVPAWLVEECQFDAYSETRELFAR